MGRDRKNPHLRASGRDTSEMGATGGKRVGAKQGYEGEVGVVSHVG